MARYSRLDQRIEHRQRRLPVGDGAVERLGLPFEIQQAAGGDRRGRRIFLRPPGKRRRRSAAKSQ